MESVKILGFSDKKGYKKMSGENISGNRKKVIALDFFCGCGGVTNGLRKAGIEVIAGFDIDPEVRYAYEENNSGSVFFNIDISKTGENVKAINKILESRRRDALIFSACAPCQPFSLHNRNHKWDYRKSLMIEFIKVIKRLPIKNRPEVILFENVGTMRKRGERVLNIVIEQFEKMGFAILGPRIINVADFGVPQSRKRLIFVAVKNCFLRHNDRFNWDYFDDKFKEEKVSVKDAISHLPVIPHGHRLNRQDPLHVTRALSSVNLQRIRQITRPGQGREMWDKKYNLECYKKHDGHKDVYGRMSWDGQAPTLTCRCISISNGRFGHPEQDRAISLREAAILQTLDCYKFKEPILLNRVAQQIGNAVPPKLATKIGKFVLEII
ncbi:MAG: DNA cytosine methyltransferase [Patescibacteria group bacterium]